MTRTFRLALAAALTALFCLWAPTPFGKTKPDDNQATLEKLELFADIFSRVRNEYVEEVDDADLISDALNGALSSLDPHSAYVPPADFVEQQKSARREYGGLGIEVTLENGLVKVNYALEDAPAYGAGIRTGDYITAVEGERVYGKSLDDAIKGMKGLAGDPVTVTVLKPDNTSRDIVVIRQVVRGRAVRHRTEDGLGYVFIETFNNAKLAGDLELALDDLKRRLGGSLPGLIIDMRGNRGGLLTQSVEVSGLFLDGGEVLSARGREAEDTERYNAEAGQYDENLPVVVLINSGSASAAEIVAGALQDRGRAVIMGRRSFGKGSVQSVIPLKNETGALRLTTQRYYTPSGESIQGRGIMPDVLVAFGSDTGELRKRFREDSLRNSLSNADETQFEEDYDKIIYPPEDWDETEDFQLSQAIEMLKTSKHRSALKAAQAAREANPL